MRPVRIIATIVLTAAVAATGCTARSAAVDQPPAPTPPAVDTPAPPTPNPAPNSPTPAPEPPAPTPPVLADGHYDAYIRTVDSRHDRLVVDLVQVFHDHAAIDAAIADGRPRDSAQYLGIYVRNQNPRLRTLPLAGDLRVDLADPCGDPPGRGALLTRLATHAHRVGWYFVLTVSDGAVQRVQERFAGNAC